MINKKICMLGGFAVGKTSLVQQYVTQIFSEKYHTTLGVKVDKKSVRIANQEIQLILWDIHGKDRFTTVSESYLRGMAGYLLVVDGTRAETLDTAHILQSQAEKIVGQVPFILMLNKIDLATLWEIPGKNISALKKKSWAIIRTSAKTGEGVEEAFMMLATQIMKK
jgi:small GTP-binding protein